MSDDFFAPPPFQPEQALIQLKRHLRELQLSEHNGRFTLRGMPVAEVSGDGGQLTARAVKQLARTPEWTAVTLNNAADVRKFVDALKASLARWNERDESH